MQTIDVLSGYVELINLMPHPAQGISADLYAVNMARTSFLGESKGEEADLKLLKYLIEHKHLSPLEHIKFTFKVKVDIATARQWFRYRTGVFSELSRRYTEVDEDEFYIPTDFRAQSSNNKQASDGLISDQVGAQDIFESAVASAWDSYAKLIELNVAREQARLVLPVASMTTFIWTTDARNLLHFLKERCDEHAQYEIRQYALAIMRIVRYYMPHTLKFMEM